MAEIHNGYVSLVETDSPSPLLKSPSSSFKDLEAGVAEAAESESRRTHRHPTMVRGVQMGRGWARRSYRTLGSLSPRSGGRFSREDEGHHHFLDECFLCKKQLGGHRDIFMYRGDMPFCSEECRQEQIDIDEDKENNWTKVSMKTAASREQQKPNASQAIHIRVAGTIVAG